jgi:hypothetical protein
MAEEDKDRSYTSRYRGGWKKWLLIYLAVGAVVYLLIYLFFLNGYGG